MKRKKTEVEQIEEFLRKEGFTEITEKEINSPEYKDSLLKIYRAVPKTCVNNN